MTLTALMIDENTTRDRDDAISVSAHPNGWSATVYVTAVADHVAIGSPVDQSAATQGHTIYAPGHYRPMLGTGPERQATLSETRDQTVMAIAMDFTRTGQRVGLPEITRYHAPAGTFVALDHQQTVAALADPAAHHHQPLTHAHTLARLLAADRSSHGALVVYDSTHRVMTNEEGRLVHVTSGAPEAHLIVQELMIAANRAVAEWSIDRGLAILYRNHRRSPVAPEGTHRSAELAAILQSPIGGDDLMAFASRIDLTITRAVYETTVDGHYGLQVPAYTHATSPLRRYADLVTQRLVLAAVDQDKPPYDEAQLQDIADVLAAARERSESAASEAYRQRATRAAARAIATNAVSHLDDKAFTRVLKVSVDADPDEGVVNEIVRRADDGSLSTGQVAVLFRAVDQKQQHSVWGPAISAVLDAMRGSSPTAAMSIWSARAQQQGQPTQPPEFERHEYGPPHAPMFVVRAYANGLRSDWMTSTSKKSAEQDAVWQLLHIIVGTLPSAAPESAPPLPNSQTAPSAPATAASVAIAASPVDASIPQHVWDALLGTSAEVVAKKRAAAVRNPVGWLTTLMSAAGHNRLVLVQTQEGPAHARQFTVTVTAGPASAAASSPTLRAARTAACTDVVDELFSIAADHAAQARP